MQINYLRPFRKVQKCSLSHQGRSSAPIAIIHTCARKKKTPYNKRVRACALPSPPPPKRNTLHFKPPLPHILLTHTRIYTRALTLQPLRRMLSPTQTRAHPLLYNRSYVYTTYLTNPPIPRRDNFNPRI